MLNDYRLRPAMGGAPRRTVVFLHGLGDRGDGGLLEIGRLWQSALPDCLFVCPDAPFPFDMAPPEFGGRQWFSLKDFTPDVMLEGAKQAAPLLNDYIDHILASNQLTSEQLILAGFSQGTMMALYTALRRREAVAGVIGYSGMLLGGANLAEEKLSSPPVLLVHGRYDAVVPYAAMAEAARGLEAAGVEVKTLSCACEHTIDEQGLRAGLEFIMNIWG